MIQKADKIILEKVARNLGRILKERGLSIRALALSADIPPTSISQLLAGQRGISFTAAKKIAIALRIGLDELSS